MPILGILASGQQPALNTGSYESIATTTVGAGGAGGIVFSSIPSTYTHLQLRGIMRGNRSGALDEMGMRFNGGTASVTFHNLYSDGFNALATGAAAAGWSWFTPIASASETAGSFSQVVIDILDYSNPNKYKTFHSSSGYDSNGTGRIYLASGMQLSTPAINDITIIPSNTTFVQYSQLALYGIKGV
jgi:hypothetical protein